MNKLAAEPPLTNVLKALEYQDDKGLVTTNTSEIESEREFVWQEAKDKFGMDAAYFHGSVPVVYFREFQEFNNRELWELHRSLWNYNRAPILFAVLPNEVRIYNCFKLPARNEHEFEGKHPRLLKQVIGQVADHSVLRQKLSKYMRREIISGRFAKEERSRFNRADRVDERLLNNLREVRKWLRTEGLEFPLVNRLLGRCIFVRYLEDRFLLEDSKDDLFEGSCSFMDLLETSKEGVYRCFGKLSDRFNGDLFPVSQEEIRLVKEFHLRQLGQFFKATEITSGQMCFWAYDFNYIPIELISAIYETFLKKHEQPTRNNDVHYTPPKIVDFVLSEILPFNRVKKDVKILDPACGSGIFLIEAFRRLVYLHFGNSKKLEFGELCKLLTDSIFGVDVDDDAIGVAIFSCYLALLEFLDAEDVRKDMKLPNLRNVNLFANDFFDANAPFNEHRYDIIVGNPPWGRGSTKLSRKYVDQAKCTISADQIAHVFLSHVPELLAEDGQVCLLCPSKGVLYNRRRKYVEFREEFFKWNRVTRIVDFSELRRGLFRRSSAPMAAIFFQKNPDIEKEYEITHIGLHQSPLVYVLAGIVVYGDEIKPVSSKMAISHPDIWKIALWGTPRDLALIDGLRARCSTLEEVCDERNWKVQRGVEVAKEGGPIHDPELSAMRYVPPEAIEDLRVLSGEGCKIGKEYFARTRDKIFFRGPRVLSRSGVVGKGYLYAAFAAFEAVFNTKVHVVRGCLEDANRLKVVSAYLTSTLARYYHFLTSSSWGVERSEILLEEQKRFPFPNLCEDNVLFGDLVELVEHVQKCGTYDTWQSDLDALVYQSYGLTPSEQQVVEDFVENSIDIHHSKLKSKAFKEPSTKDVERYAKSFKAAFCSVVGESVQLQSIIHQDNSCYRAVSFHLIGEDSSEIENELGLDVDDHLEILERIAIEDHDQDLYYLKNIRVYEGRKIHIVKPAEKRFWTASAGYNDADSTIDELLSTDISQQLRESY